MEKRVKKSQNFWQALIITAAVFLYLPISAQANIQSLEIDKTANEAPMFRGSQVMIILPDIDGNLNFNGQESFGFYGELINDDFSPAAKTSTAPFLPESFTEEFFTFIPAVLAERSAEFSKKLQKDFSTTGQPALSKIFGGLFLLLAFFQKTARLSRARGSSLSSLLGSGSRYLKFLGRQNSDINGALKFCFAFQKAGIKLNFVPAFCFKFQDIRCPNIKQYLGHRMSKY